MLVSDMQNQLNHLGFWCGTPDGYIGAKTQAGIRKFQRATNLVPDGKPGPTTIAMLEAVLARKPKIGHVPVQSTKAAKTRHVDMIVIHCTATKEHVDIGAKEIDKMHRAQGWSQIGYHYVFRLDGKQEDGRAEHIIGAHVAGYNANSIGLSYIGGVDSLLKPKDTRTIEQRSALVQCINDIASRYPIKRIVGHRDLSPDKNGNGSVEPHEWIKQCPCFDAVEEYKQLLMK